MDTLITAAQANLSFALAVSVGAVGFIAIVCLLAWAFCLTLTRK